MVQSPWLQAAFGLEVGGVHRVILPDAETALTPVTTQPTTQPGHGKRPDDWPAAEQIVEPVWIWEPEQD
ncbi:MAG TPA: hypothetical protein VHA57_10145 [Actinomycetota bacterium]|nr:hypothetical protein [Actinomycetota bacterium]